MSSHKRKRAVSVSSLPSSQPLPSDTINPHSHSENTIKQLHVAGLTEDDFLPSTYIPQFPHRPIRPSHLPQQGLLQDDSASNDDDNDDDDNDDDDAGKGASTTASPPPSSQGAKEKARRRAKRMRDAHEQQLGLLTNVILRALEENDIPRAKRAFGLVRRSEVRGKPVDLRRHGLWSLGAEVLMRDGAGEGEGAGGGAIPTQRRRWGTAANMPQLRAYLEELIRQYPYNRLHPRSISDVDFYPVLFGCEFYNAWAEHRLALERLERDAEAWSAGDSDIIISMPEEPYADDDDGHGHGHGHMDQIHITGSDRRLRQAKADLGLHAMETMRNVATRMDALMERAPYKTGVEMLRLRGMVALYVGDLNVPPPPRTADEEEEGKRIRDEERERAGRLFGKMRDHGGRVDAFTEKWLGGGNGEDSGADDEDDMESAWSGLPVFSSLQIR